MTRLALTILLLLLAGCQSSAPPDDAAGADAAAQSSPASTSSDSAPAEDDANARIAAAVPWTDIWLLPLDAVLAGDQKAPAKNVTARRGYDNQPAFSADGRHVFFASIRDGRQSDIYRYDTVTGETSQVTDTPESEYSPTPRGEDFSTVQVALDGTQRLWWYSNSGSPVRAIREDITGVGYHAWLSERRVALFLVEDPLRLVHATLGEAGAHDIATNIGRSLHALPGGRLAYVHKAGEEEWWVHDFDPGSGRDTRRARTLPAAEDLAWLADGSALMASGRTLHRLAPDAASFEPLVELMFTLHGDIGRMAVDPAGRWLAVVVTRTETQ